MRNKKIINPANGHPIREFNYIFQVEDLKTNEISTVSYILVTDRTLSPMIWNNRSDGFWNARPELAEEFLKNGEQWYDFTNFNGNLKDIKKMNKPHGEAPEGYRLHLDYQLNVNLIPGTYYDASGRVRPYEWSVERWSASNERYITVDHGTADDLDTAISKGKQAFNQLMKATKLTQE